MATLGQMDQVALMITQGWQRAPSHRPPLEHKPGEPILMVKGGDYVMVVASSDVVPATAADISGW